MDETWERPCAWCEAKTRQNLAHIGDLRPFYALCDLCLKCHGAGMSIESVWEESGKKGGTGYYKRKRGTTDWVFNKWTQKPTSRSNAVDKITTYQNLSSEFDFALLQCSDCHRFHNGIAKWTGDKCGECKPMKCSKCKAYTSNYSVVHNSDESESYYCEKCQLNIITEAAKISAQGAAKYNSPAKKGDVTRIPKSSSPMFTEQWSCVGSAKLPYIISRKKTGDGSTDDERFCCSCPAFTRNTPREPCKHILKVKLFEGMSLAAKAGTVVPATHAKEYAEFLAMKAQKERIGLTDGEIKMVGDNTGRKFR